MKKAWSCETEIELERPANDGQIRVDIRTVRARELQISPRETVM
jgi:hypothetical protein